jgi:methionyl-tRNA formyltransferase
MRLAFIGNNDAPFRLFSSLSKEQKKQVQFIAYQKEHPDRKRLKGIPTYLITSDEELVEFVAKHQIDILFNSFANFRFNKVLDACRVLNVHPSPLPKYRGRHPLQWALINREPSFAITVHEMSYAIDAGRIGFQSTIQVEEGWSVRELRSALLKQLESSFSQFIQDLFDSNVYWLPNLEEDANYITKRSPEDSLIKVSESADQIYALIMAMREEAFPAYFNFNNAKVNVVNAKKETKQFVGYVPGIVVGSSPGTILVICRDGSTLRLYFAEQKLQIPLNTRI